VVATGQTVDLIPIASIAHAKLVDFLFPFKLCVILDYCEVKFESATDSVGCKGCEVKVDPAVPVPECRSHSGEMTEEFASTLRFGPLAISVNLLQSAPRRIFVRFRLPNQRTTFPAKMREAPNVGKRSGSESTSAKIWGLEIGNRCAI
jgi:hypothetical protein